MKLRVTVEVIEGPQYGKEPERLNIGLRENHNNMVSEMMNVLSDRKRSVSFECEARNDTGTVIALGNIYGAIEFR